LKDHIGLTEILGLWLPPAACAGEWLGDLSHPRLRYRLSCSSWSSLLGSFRSIFFRWNWLRLKAAGPEEA